MTAHSPLDWQAAAAPDEAALCFIGRLSTPWSRPQDCPATGDPEAGPVCFAQLDPAWVPALEGILPGDRLQLLYWMQLGRRDLLVQEARPGGPARGIFAQRSAQRPNPIAAARVQVIDIDGGLLSLRGLDCPDGTPLLDIRPAAGAFGGGAG